MAESNAPQKGLEHVTMGDSKVSLVAGETGGLSYRGFDVNELVPAASYEAVAHLLLYGDPPDTDPPAELTLALRERRGVPVEVQCLSESLSAGLPPLEAMRTLLSGLGDGHYEYPPTIDQGLSLVAGLPTLFTGYLRRSDGKTPVSPDPALSHVANYLWMLTGTTPDPEKVRALETYFVLLADHGMNASTFALCVVISTNSDLISAATAALGALKGPIHGGAPSRVVDMLDAIGESGAADRYIADRLGRKEVLFGFGHRAYKVEDPRAILLKRCARKVADPARLELALAVEETALARLRAHRPGARIYTNVEYWGAVVLEAVGLPRRLFTPTFALARTVGWVAHALEQANDNRLIRPDVRYLGPTGRRWPLTRAV
ncbi:MAG: citrate synthase [Candidatus Lutacidiplasmatales archaeon]